MKKNNVTEIILKFLYMKVQTCYQLDIKNHEFNINITSCKPSTFSNSTTHHNIKRHRFHYTSVHAI